MQIKCRLPRQLQPCGVFLARSGGSRIHVFKLGKRYTFSPDHDLSIDLGIPALGLDAKFRPQFEQYMELRMEAVV